MARRFVETHGRLAYREDASRWEDRLRDTGTFEKRSVPAVQIPNLDSALRGRDLQVELGDGGIMDRYVGELRPADCDLSTYSRGAGRRPGNDGRAHAGGHRLGTNQSACAVFGHGYSPFIGTDRYSILGAIAKGGMARVYLGRMVASAGFNRLVAIKRLHDDLGEDPEFVAMLLDEARLTARIRHTNVVDVLDLVVKDGAFALVLEWVEGASVSTLLKRSMREKTRIPQEIVVSIMQGVVRGLAAAHEARAEDGAPLGIVHRDVSPQNVLVGVDGIPRIIDFGVAKARGKLEATRPGEIRGKYAYMAPEQLMGRPVTPQVDVYAAGVMMWELLTGKRLFKADDERVVCARVLQGDIASPGISPEIDDIVMRATAREPSSRYLDAREFLAALEAFPRASDEEVGAWVRSLAADTIEAQQKLIQSASTPEPPRSLEALLRELTPVRDPPPAPPRKPPSWWLAAAIAAPFVIGGLVASTIVVATAGAKPRQLTAAQIAPPPPEPTAVEPAETAMPAASIAIAPAPVRPKHRASPRATQPPAPPPPPRDPTDHR
jgi:serine/threonine protein kinase